jgi:hypothetical protein
LDFAAEPVGGQLPAFQAQVIGMKNHACGGAFNVNWFAVVASPAQIRHKGVSVFLPFPERLQTS